jgi:hypothetical protein
MASELDRLGARVEQLGRARAAARRLDRAELAIVLASSPRESRTARSAWLEARHDLRALAHEERAR